VRVVRVIAIELREGGSTGPIWQLGQGRGGARPNVTLCLCQFSISVSCEVSTRLVVDRPLHFGFVVPNT
jgi:hypothetical protein